MFIILGSIGTFEDTGTLRYGRGGVDAAILIYLLTRELRAL
jgi:hypothetical protein